MKILISLTMFFALVQSAFADSRCDQSTGWWWSTVITCEHSLIALEVTEDDVRNVRYQVPTGDAPAGGWPVVFIYQGSYIPVQFSGRSGQPWGGFHQIRLIRKLLNNGFAVIAPEAVDRTFWDTNTLGGANYKNSSDYGYLSTLFDMVAEGEFGDLNSNRMYATGISSGGVQHESYGGELPRPVSCSRDTIRLVRYLWRCPVFCSIGSSTGSSSDVIPSRNQGLDRSRWNYDQLSRPTV